MNDESKETEINKYSNTLTPQLNSHRPQHNIAVVMENRSLYNASELGNRADDYDIQKENEIETDLVVRAQNPGLLAFRNQNTKANKLKPNVRPTSNIVLTPLHSSNQTSLINPKPPTSSGFKKTLSPMQIAQKEIEEERNSLAFKEDPIAYFSKRKDGSGHLFITLNFARDRNDPNFSPYELMKVPAAERNAEYFTMSASGVTHILGNGESDHLPLEKWASETSSYKMVRALRVFNQYRYWKSFRVWKNFIKRQRYEKMTSIVKAHPFFLQQGFYMTTLHVLETSCDQMVKQYLLSFWPQRKYMLKVFQKEIEENKEALISEYQNYLMNVLEFMLQLDGDIRDPTRVLVKESDFTRGKSYTPNLGQLMVIREKVEAERNRRNEIVHNEVKGFCYFIRMIDYLLLESLSTACYESWRNADQNVSQEMSSIFQIEIYFNDEGGIAFKPTLEELLTSINSSLAESINTINKLPRLISESQLRPHLREVYSSVHKLFDDGPHFDEFCESNSDYRKFQDHIVKVITESYHESEEHSQGFIEFYPLFKIGKEWTPQIYIMPRGGESHRFDLAASHEEIDNEEKGLSFDSSTELIVDFDAVRRDIASFIQYETRLTQFHACTVRGALYIDSKVLRGILTPIPIHSIRAIQCALRDLIQKKIDDINRIFRFCSKKLKKEPGTLEQYVDHCEFTTKVQAMDPYISEEISFVDRLYVLFESVGYSSNDSVEHSRNPLHDGFRSFKNDQERANTIKKMNSQKFVQILNDKLRLKETKLQRYNTLIQSYPSSIDEANMEYLIPQIEKAKEKLVKLEPDIHALMRCQEVMGVKLHDLTEYDIVQRGALFTEQLFRSVQSFNKIQQMITNVPFSNINIEDFSNEVTRLRDEANELIKASSTQNVMLDEMYERLSRIIPFLEQLKALSESKMHYRHWNALFSQCNQQNSYYAQIKIDELISLGVLNETEKIRTITSTAKGESQLEADFQAVTSRWQEVQIPLLDTQMKSDDTLLLGDLNPLFQQISDTQITLKQMLLYPYVQGIKEAILQFSNSLESYAKIMDAWYVFQSNWVILSPFFAQEETKEILPHQANKFTMVKRRWISLVRHTLENTSLVHVCSFPSLHEMLTENNKTMQTLLQSSMKFIDTKRAIMPRFYFMSDAEIMVLFSTSDFQIFSQHLRKIFMEVQSFKTHSQDDIGTAKAANAQIFSRLRILGLSGNNVNTLKFIKNVQCVGPIENWVNSLIETMKISLKESVYDALKNYSLLPTKEWIKSYPTSVSLLAVQIKFTNEIDECFNNFENNVHSFTDYKKHLIELYKNFSNILHDDNMMEYFDQISTLITTFDSHIHMVELLSERIPNFTQEWNWHHYLKLRLVDNKLYVDFDGVQIEHGYEFYGSSHLFIESQASLIAKNSICHSINTGELPFCFGSAEVGKKHLIASLASLYGQFLFTFPAFIDTSKVILNRIFDGVASCGCWLAFHDLQCHSQDNLTFIYDTLREFQNPKIEGKVLIDGKQISYLKSARILFTGHSLLQEDKTFLPQLRSILKPLSLGAPDIVKLMCIKFAASGYFEGEIISPKLVNMLHSISSSFSYLPSKSVLSPALKIVDEAKSILMFISKSNTIPFLTYFESPTLAEEYSVVYSTYKRYIIGIRKEHHQLFLQYLFSYFPLFDDFEKFKINLAKHECFDSDEIDKILLETLQELISDTSESLSEYLIERAISLYNLMVRYPCVIIYGPPNSGKTQIVDLLISAFDKILENPSKAVHFKELMPIKLFDVFHNNETWERMFGEMKPDNELGQVWQCGEMQTYVTNLMKYQSTHERLLRLNGPLTEKFVNFLSQMAGSAESGAFRLNTLDSIEFDKHIHILVETDNIKNLSPSCFCYCGILPMENEHTRLVYPTNLDMFELIDPLQILNRVLSRYRDHVPEIMKQHIITLFPQIAGEIIKYVYQTPNYLYHSDSHMRTQDSEVIVAEHLSYLSILYMFNYLDVSAADKSSIDHIRIIMILSLFTVFSSIIEYTNIVEFDNWIRNKFDIKVPQDWVGFEVNQRFWDSFPRPSLLSLRFYENELLPHRYELLEEPPIVSSNPITSEIPLLSNVSICPASYLPLVFQGGILLRQKQHFMLYGPVGCGKSTLLQFIFKNNEEIIPMVIPVSKWSTKHTLQQFIQSHSQIIQKKYMLTAKVKTYALIFDNVPFDNMKAIEFIRMLASTSTVPITSRKDPKYLELLNIHNFFIIVTSRTVSNFPPRFLAKFFLMKLDSPSNITIREIYQGLGKHFGINNRITEVACSFAERFCNCDTTPFHFLALFKTFPAFPLKNAASDSDMSTLIKLLLSEMNLYFLHRIVSKDDMNLFTRHFDSSFKLIEHKELLKSFLKGPDIIYTEISYDLKKKNTVLQTNVAVHPMHLIQEELNFYLTGFNETHSEKLIIKFTPPVIKQWATLQRAMTFPGSNVLLVGDECTGRYTLTRFVAHMKEYELIHLKPNTHIDFYNVHIRRLYLISSLSKKIKNCILDPKPMIIYMKVNRYSRMDVEFLSHLFEIGDPTPFFACNELEEMYYMYGTKHGIPQDERLNMFYQIKDIIRLCVHAVFSVEKHYDELLYPLFTKVEFLSNTPKFVKLSAKEIFTLFPRLERLREKFPENLTSVLQKIHEIFREKNARLSSNSFYDFIDNFIHYYSTWLEDLQNLTKNGNEAIGFIEEMKTDALSIGQQLADEKPNITKQKAEDDQIQQSFIVKKDTINIRLKKIDEEEMKQQEFLKSLSDEIGPLRTQLNDFNVHVDLAKGKLSSMNQPMLNSLLAYVEDPPPVFKYVMDLLCAMMDQPQSFGKKLFRDDKVVNIIVDRIIPQYIEEPTLKRAKNVSERNKFDSRDANTVCPSLTPFYEWANAVLNLAIVCRTLKEKEALYDEKSAAFSQFSEDMVLERESIQQVSESLEKEIQEFQIGVDKLKSQEGNFEYLEERQRTLNQLLEGMDKLIEKWKNNSANYKDIEFKLIGQAITFSAYLSYSGMLDPKVRPDLFRSVHEILKSNKYTDDYHQPHFFKYLLAIIDEANEEFFMRSDNPAFLMTDHTIRFIETVLRTPLIIDPDGLINSAISQSMKPKRIMHYSIMSHNLQDVFVKCMSEGKTLLLEDVDWLHPLLLELLPIELYPNNINSSSQQNTTIEINGQKITRSLKFKLFLFSSKNDSKELPLELLARVTLIDVSSESLEATRDIFTDVFVQQYTPEISSKIGSAERIALHLTIQKHKFEREILEIISEILTNQKNDEEYDFLNDEELILNFFQSKDCYFTAERSRDDDNSSTKVENSIEQALLPFKPCIDRCFICWEAISRFLPKINPGRTFCLHDFVDSIKAAINTCGFSSVSSNSNSNNASSGAYTSARGVFQLSEAQLSELQRTIIAHMFDFIMPSLSFKEIYFLMFYITFKLRVLNGTVKEDDFKNIVVHLSEEYSGTFDMKVAEIRTGDTLDQLKFSNIGSVFSIITKFVMEEFGKNFMSRFPMFSLEAFTSSPPATPILIKMAERDPTLLFDEYASNRNKSSFMYSISLSGDEKSLKKAETTLKKAVENGYWVVIHCHLQMATIGAFLNDMVSQLNNPPNEFRLVIICSTTKHLPRSLVNRCKRIEYEDFPSIKQQMQEIYQHFRPILMLQQTQQQLQTQQVNKNDAKLKKLLYIESLTFSFIRYRMFVDPIGFFYKLPMDELMLKPVLLSTIAAYYNHSETSIITLRKFIMSTFFNGITSDEFDMIKIKMYLDFDPEKCLVPQTSEENPIWEVPSFTGTSSANQSILKLPHFSSGEVLLIDKIISNPLIQWNLSRWISKPFLKLNRPTPSPYHQLKIQLESLKALFPPDVDTSIQLSMKGNMSPMSLFLLCECENLNKSIMKIRTEIHNALYGMLPDVLKEVAIDRVPQRWCEIVGFNGSRLIARFFTFIRDKADFLSHWMRNGTYITQSVNVNHVCNIRGLLLSFLNEMSTQRRTQIDTNDFTCIISDDFKGYGPGITLTNIWMVGGNWDQQEKKFVAPNNKTLPLRRFQEVMFCPKTLQKDQENESKFYNCPLYISLPCRAFALGVQKERSDGESNNLICKVRLRTDVPIKDLVANGVALVCHLPEMFTH